MCFDINCIGGNIMKKTSSASAVIFCAILIFLSGISSAGSIVIQNNKSYESDGITFFQKHLSQEIDFNNQMSRILPSFSRLHAKEFFEKRNGLQGTSCGPHKDCGSSTDKCCSDGLGNYWCCHEDEMCSLDGCEYLRSK